MQEKIRIRTGVLGAGTVGSTVLEHYFSGKLGSEQIDITKIVVKDPNDPTKKRSNIIPSALYSSDAKTVLGDPSIKLVVSLLGTEDFETECIDKALCKGKFVVTANKEVIAKHGPELLQTAREHQVGLLFEASVGGGIPIIDTFRQRHSPNTFHSILGIINGTTNYIFTKMTETGMDYQSALKEAKALGYAEPDPTNDIEGYDSRYKLAILASLAFKKGWVDYSKIHTEGISKITWQDLAYAKNLGYAVKLIASAKNTAQGIEAWVAPTFISQKHDLANINGVTNAIYYEGTPIDTGMIVGKGAGKPTSASVWSDIVSACRHIKEGNVPASIYTEKARIVPFEEIENRNFLRVTVVDREGVFGRVCTSIGSDGVSINQINQLDGVKWIAESEGKLNNFAEIVIETDPAKEGNMDYAFKNLGFLPDVAGLSSKIRIIKAEEYGSYEDAQKVLHSRFF